VVAMLVAWTDAGLVADPEHFGSGKLKNIHPS
jgi:hypothetical protein